MGLGIYQSVTSTSPLPHPPVPKSCSNAPHVRPTGWANAPPLGHIFLPLTGQDRFKTICYKYQLAFFILKLDKGTSYLHSKASLSFFGPFLGSHSVTNTISCLLNCLTFSLCFSWSNSPHSTAWCQIPIPAVVLKSNSLLLLGCQNARGMPGGGGGGMLRLQIDRCITIMK